MKIQITSDLHQEFSYSIIHDMKADILIVAGDLSYVECLYSTLRTLRSQFSTVIFVPGNHEYYHNSISSTNEMLADIHIPGVHILNRFICHIDDVTFIGATGWPNHSYKEVLIGGQDIIDRQKNNDWNFIHNFNDTYKSHGQKDADFIKTALRDYRENKCVVITHFIPLPECRGARNFHMSDAAFINDYSSWCFANPPHIWIHGHSHSFFYRILGDTLFIRNPFGYIHENEHNTYDDFVLEI
jgi:predicted phosphohydrolase